MPAFFEFFSALFHPSARPSDDQTIKLTRGLHETDDNFFPGENLSQMYRDRYDYDRKTILAECLRAWRVNPLARRIVKLMSMFIVHRKQSTFSRPRRSPGLPSRRLPRSAILPKSGFKYAFENVADFIAVGMFHFQIAEDTAAVREVLEKTSQRQRQWHS